MLYYFQIMGSVSKDLSCPLRTHVIIRHWAATHYFKTMGQNINVKYDNISRSFESKLRIIVQ